MKTSGLDLTALALALVTAAAHAAAAAEAATADTKHAWLCRRGHRCPANQVCVWGRCQCLHGTYWCNGWCRAPDFFRTDVDCGRCGRACRWGTTCQLGLRGL